MGANLSKALGAFLFPKHSTMAPLISLQNSQDLWQQGDAAVDVGSRRSRKNK